MLTMSLGMAHTGAPLSQARPGAPPSSPDPSHAQNLQASEQPLKLEYLEQLLLKLIRAKCPDSAENSGDPKPVVLRGAKPEAVVAESSRLEFKMVDEQYVRSTVC
jgi:hypothetical protein